MHLRRLLHSFQRLEMLRRKPCLIFNLASLTDLHRSETGSLISLKEGTNAFLFVPQIGLRAGWKQRWSLGVLLPQFVSITGRWKHPLSALTGSATAQTRLIFDPGRMRMRCSLFHMTDP